jgi:hypothetical protein
LPYTARHEVLTAVLRKLQVFRNVALYRRVKAFPHFEGT